VRTARNTRDNIEQVVVDNPAVGTWTVEVFGFAVPQGPQPFSISASPNLGDGGPCTPPAAPAGVAASDATSCAAVSVSWGASAGATSYEIWRNTVDNSGTATRIATDSASPYDDTTAAPATTYFYWVRAASTCGTSAFSNSDSGSRGSGSAPPAPKMTRATDGNCNSVTVTWRAASGATGYQIWRGTTNNSSSAVQIGTSTTLSFVDTTGLPGTTYSYWVKATNSCGTSGFSNRDRGSSIQCP